MKSPVLDRLVKKYPISFSAINKESEQLNFYRQDVSKDTSQFIEACLAEHAILVIEFDVLCNQLITQKQEINNEQIETALYIARILETNYFHLQMKTHANSMIEYQVVLDGTTKEKKLKAQQITLDDIEFGNWVRKTTISTNVKRLLLIRIKRFLETLALVIKLQQYQTFIHYLSQLANPVIAIIGWAFFAPRLYVTLYVLSSYYYAYLNASKETKNYFYQLLQVQLNYRWFEGFNDGPWHFLGLAVCCLLLAHLAPIAIYLNVILYIYDILLPSIRFYIDNVRLVNLYNGYINSLEDIEDKTGADAQKIIVHCNFLEKKMIYEQIRLSVSVITTTLLALVTVFLMPCFAIHPAVPIVCAALLVIITISSYLAGKKVEKMKPVCSVNALEQKLNLRNNSMFKKNEKDYNATQFQSGFLNLCNGAGRASR